MQRRRFLTAGGALGITALAGCSGGDDSVQDSDGDGVIDSQDYAPNDPEVQEKADLQGTVTPSPTPTSTATAAPTASPTPSPTATPTPTETPTPTPTEAPTPTPTEPNSIDVDENAFYDSESRFVEYSSETATVFVHPDGPGVETLDSQDVWILASEYGETTTTGRGHTSLSNTGSGGTEATVSLDWDTKPTGTNLYYWLVLAPQGTTYEELSGENAVFLRETNPFEIEADGVTISPASVSELEDVGADDGEKFNREVREGEFEITLTGTTQGQAWEVIYYIFKSAYIRGRRRDHGRSRSEFVAYETESGFSSEIAGIFDDEAERNGFDGKRMKIEFVIDAIQHIPYVPDDVSTGYDDYTKYGTELLAELAGDCEDTSILMAGVLQSEPFGYDMILIQPPGHMAVGIYGQDDLPGYYWELDGRRYYYIETTGSGWAIGDIPEEYEGVDAYTYQV